LAVRLHHTGVTLALSTTGPQKELAQKVDAVQISSILCFGKASKGVKAGKATSNNKKGHVTARLWDKRGTMYLARVNWGATTTKLSGLAAVWPYLWLSWSYSWIKLYTKAGKGHPNQGGGVLLRREPPRQVTNNTRKEGGCCAPPSAVI
jgi:hypothetical protein